MADFTAMLAGYRRFREHGWARQRERWAELARGQAPKVMVIACSDSRVEPALIFDTNPGELFVVRNVANLVPPFETGGGRHGVSAALEFAVTILNVGEIVILGHGACGGCAAALSGAFSGAELGQGGFIADWIALLDDARDRVRARHVEGPAAARAMEHEAVRASLANLRTFPFVVPREADGRLRLHGAWFALEDGVLHVLDEATGAFAAVN